MSSNIKNQFYRPNRTRDRSRILCHFEFIPPPKASLNQRLKPISSKFQRVEIVDQDIAESLSRALGLAIF